MGASEGAIRAFNALPWVQNLRHELAMEHEQRELLKRLENNYEYEETR